MRTITAIIISIFICATAFAGQQSAPIRHITIEEYNNAGKTVEKDAHGTVRAITVIHGQTFTIKRVCAVVNKLRF